MELYGKKINVLGDSITQGVGTTCEETRFVSLISKETGAVCRNYGLSGTRIARQHGVSNPLSFDRDFNLRAREMDPDADIVLVFGGTNDFGHGDADIGSFEDTEPDTFCGALNSLYSYLLSTYPKAKIVILTPTHRAEESRVRNGKALTLKGYVDLIREAAETYSLPVLDLYKESGLTPKVEAIRQLYMPDGLHPSDAGNRVLADRIIAYLKAL